MCSGRLLVDSVLPDYWGSPEPSRQERTARYPFHFLAHPETAFVVAAPGKTETVSDTNGIVDTKGYPVRNLCGPLRSTEK